MGRRTYSDRQAKLELRRRYSHVAAEYRDRVWLAVFATVLFAAPVAIAFALIDDRLEASLVSVLCVGVMGVLGSLAHGQ